MSDISFDTQKISQFNSTFNEKAAALKKSFDDIQNSLNIIEANWSGPQHDSAARDKDAAEKNIADALSTIKSMEEGTDVLARNASIISYNG